MSDIRSWVRQQGAPVTLGIMASLIVSTLGLWFSHLKGFEQLVFGSDWPKRPWSILTYPWAYMPLGSGFGILCFIFLLMWTWWIGGSLERELGSSRFGVLMLTMTALPAIILWIGAKGMGARLALFEPWMPEAGMTMVWCVRNPSAQIMMYGILPLSGKWLGWLTVGTVLLTMGLGNPVFGVLACLHLVVAWAFAAEKLPIAYKGGSFRAKQEEVHATRAQARYDESYYDEVRRREQDRAERERLRKLFGESLDEEDKK